MSISHFFNTFAPEIDIFAIYEEDTFITYSPYGCVFRAGGRH